MKYKVMAIIGALEICVHNGLKGIHEAEEIRDRLLRTITSDMNVKIVQFV